MFLLSGCFSGNEYPSGLLDTTELRRGEEERRMVELKQTHLLRLGVAAGTQKNMDSFRKKLESKGWRVQVIPCPEKRLTGLLRSGALDLICLPGITETESAKLGFRLISSEFCIENQLLYQELKGLQ